MKSVLHHYIAELEFSGDLFSDVEKLFNKHNAEATWFHCTKVAHEAKALALQFHADPAIAERAGWLHDIGTIIPNEDKVAVAHALHIPILEEELAFPYILHQKLSSEMTTQIFELTDPMLLNAIECHTTLRKSMSLMDKILFIGDKLSWDQAHAAPFLKEIRKNVNDHLLDEAIMIYFNHVWSNKEKMKVVHLWLLEARQSLLKESEGTSTDVFE
ncbi:UNVERIFIED_CONTAM: putative HD superfamily hydrolase involved in NAD metabolism [Paenibacillus sp. PvR008]